MFLYYFFCILGRVLAANLPLFFVCFMLLGGQPASLPQGGLILHDPFLLRGQPSPPRFKASCRQGEGEPAHFDTPTWYIPGTGVSPFPVYPCFRVKQQWQGPRKIVSGSRLITIRGVENNT